MSSMTQYDVDAEVRMSKGSTPTTGLVDTSNMLLDELGGDHVHVRTLPCHDTEVGNQVVYRLANLIVKPDCSGCVV